MKYLAKVRDYPFVLLFVLLELVVYRVCSCVWCCLILLAFFA